MQDGNEQVEWLRSEYEWAWTTQSDINSRIVTVYTGAMSVSVPLLAAIIGWVISKDSQSYQSDPIAGSFLFLIPNFLTLPLFWHNLGQRREIIRIAGYWKVLIDKQANRRTWTTRIEKYRELVNQNRQLSWLGREANDPIPGSYWIVYLSSFTAAMLNIFLKTTCVYFPLFLGLMFLFVALGGMLFYLTVMWKKVLKSDLKEVTAVWEQVLQAE